MSNKTMPSHNMYGDVVFVSGGASGIGLAIAEVLAEAGASVVIADRDQRVEACAQALASKYGVKALGVSLEVTDSASWDFALAEAIQCFGEITYFFNNAGVAGAFSPTEDIPISEWHRVLDINLNGVFFGVRALLPHLKSHGRKAYIVNTASLAGFLPMSHAAVYNASKAAVVAVTETLAAELADSNIQVSVLCPGPVRTAILRDAIEAVTDASELSATQRQQKQLRQAIEHGNDPKEVALGVLRRIREGAFYIFTEQSYQTPIERHYAQILAAYSSN